MSHSKYTWRVARAYGASLIVSVATLGWTGSVRAQVPDGVLLPTEARAADLRGTGAAMDRVLRSRLETHAVVRLGATPALVREDLQLAVGCIARSAECFSAVATQLETRLLLMPSLEPAGDELVVGLTVFDAEAQSIASVTRRVPEASASDVLDVVDSMVREAFSLPAADPETLATGGSASSEGSPAAGAADAPRDPAPAIAAGGLLGVGAIALALGVGVGAMSRDTLAQYESASVTTEADVDAATALYDRASTESTIANVLMPVGAAVAVGGAAWLIVELLSGSEPAEVALAPMVGPGMVGASLRGSLGGAL
jgi:hypothetical protein